MGDRALCITKGVCGGVWPGISALTSIKTTYFGELADAVSGVYLPRGNADGSQTDTFPSEVYVYNGSTFVNTYSADALGALVSAGSNYASLGSTFGYAWLGTPQNSSMSYAIYYVSSTYGYFNNYYKDRSCVICPTFILDLTKVKTIDNTIVTKGSESLGSEYTYVISNASARLTNENYWVRIIESDHRDGFIRLELPVESYTTMLIPYTITNANFSTLIDIYHSYSGGITVWVHILGNNFNNQSIITTLIKAYKVTENDNYKVVLYLGYYPYSRAVASINRARLNRVYTAKEITEMISVSSVATVTPIGTEITLTLDS